MTHPLQHKIDLLRSRLRRLMVAYGLSWIVAVGLGAIIVLGLVDYLIRAQDPGIRLIFLLVWLAAMGWTAYRRLYVPLRAPLRDVDLARRVERGLPESSESLASAIEFLKQSEEDPIAGSPALRRAVITETTARTDLLDFTSLVRTGPVVHAALWAAAACLAAAILIVLDPCSSRIAVARLLLPLGNTSWPQRPHAVLPRPVEPPRLDTVSIRLVPPAYTGWPEENTDRQIRGLVGTQMKIAGTSSKPLRSIELRFDDGRAVPGQIDDGLAFSVPARGVAPLVIERSGGFRLELTDREGLLGGDELHWEITAVPDRPPTVSIERPDATVYATPQATVPLHVAAKDDLGIRRIALVVGWPAGVQPAPNKQEFALFEGSQQRGPQPDSSVAAESGEARAVDYSWELQSMRLAPGTQVEFYATATDYLAQTGKSLPRRLVVITPAELADRLAACQDAIRAAIERVLARVRQGRASLAELEMRWRESGGLDQPAVDHLRAAELDQREAARALTSTTEGVPRQVLDLLAELENNRMESPELRQRMEDLLAQIDRLERGPLPAIASELTTAIKEAQVLPPDHRAESGVAALAAAGQQQDRLIAELEQMLAQLARWNDYSRFSRELSQLLRQQEQLLRSTSRLATRTLTKRLEELSPQELADLGALGQRQAESARSLDGTLSAMHQTAGRLQSTDPTAAKTLTQAAARADQLGTSARMQAAGENIVRNQVGQATSQQKQAAADLQELLDILAHRPKQPPAGLQDTLLSLHDRQQAVIQQTVRLDDSRRAQGELNAEGRNALRDVLRKQQALRDATAALAESLQDNPVFRIAVSGAGREMDRAAALLDRDETGVPTQQAEQEALRRLAQLLEALKPVPPTKAASGPAGGQGTPAGQAGTPKRLPPVAELKMLRSLQAEVHRRTAELEKSFGGAGRLTDEARQQYNALSQEQAEVARAALKLLGPQAPEPNRPPNEEEPSP